MAIEHNAITDPDIHEPKGAAAASAGEVYIADGAASGAWTDLQAETPMVYSTKIADISTAETVYVPVTHNGAISAVYTVIDGAIATADATLTVKNAAGATVGTITVAFTGSAAGDVDSLLSFSNNSFTAGDFITVETDGASSGAAAVGISIEFVRS